MPFGRRRRIGWWSPDPRGVHPARRAERLAVAAQELRAVRDPPRHLVRDGDASMRRPAPAARLDQRRLRRRLRRAARSGLGAQRRDVARRRARRRAVRRADRRAVRRRVDVPHGDRCLEGGAGARWSTGCGESGGDAARRAVDAPTIWRRSGAVDDRPRRVPATARRSAVSRTRCRGAGSPPTPAPSDGGSRRLAAMVRRSARSEVPPLPTCPIGRNARAT